MFVHTGENLPQDPEFAADLGALGYKVNEEKQIVSIEHGHYFIFYHTSSIRTNERRKEAMHESVRELVKKELADMGVVEVYLGGEKGTKVLGWGEKEKPKEKYVQILATEKEELKKKRDVIVVIGEPSEEVGIFAWRHLMTEGGIEGGSAVGLVKKLAVLGLDSTEVDFKEEMRKKMEMREKDSASTSSSKSSSGSSTMTHCDSVMTKLALKVPGVIILNPGALLWSYQEKKTMTISTWLARKRLHAFGEDYAISKTHNYLEGHTTQEEHIETCLDSILPDLLAEDAHLYIVGMTTSAEAFIKWYQSRQCTVETSHHNHADVPGVPSMLNAMAFMEPTHDASNLKCEAVEIMLNVRGRQWVKSSQPLGTFLNIPKPVKTPDLPSFPEATHGSHLRLPDYEAAFTETAAPVLISHSGNESVTDIGTEEVGESGESDLKEAILGDEPVEISMPTTKTAFTKNGHAVNEEDASNSDQAKEVIGLEDTIDEEPIDDAMTKSYDHRREIVNCATYSGEADVDEMIWPNAMDAVLDHFKFVAEQTARPGRFFAK